jgi:uncharacterized protein with GYD domain
LPSYIVLMSRASGQGASEVPTPEQMDQLRDEIEEGVQRAHGELDALFATMGRYDFVAMVSIDAGAVTDDDLPGGPTDAVTGIALWLGQTAGVNTETLTALDAGDTTNALRWAARCGGRR